MAKRPRDNEEEPQTQEPAAKKSKPEQQQRLLFIFRSRVIEGMRKALAIPTPDPVLECDYDTYYEYVVDSAASKHDMEGTLQDLMRSYDAYETDPELLDDSFSLKLVFDFLAGETKYAPVIIDYLAAVPRTELGTWETSILDGESYFSFENGPYKAVYVLDYDAQVAKHDEKELEAENEKENK
jgi:hypothetical protein